MTAAAPALGVIPDKATIARARAKREAMRNAQTSMEQTLHGLDEDTVREAEVDSDSGEDDMNTRSDFLWLVLAGLWSFKFHVASEKKKGGEGGTKVYL